MNRLTRIVIPFMAILLFCAGAVYAQSDAGTITGVVRDASGGVIATAQVTITNEATRFERRVQTNESGFFVAPNLPPGQYSVSVELAGFKKYTTTGLRLESASSASINVELQVGQVTESVEVVASAAQLNTESAAVGKTVEQTQIQNLTLNGRNPLFLALLKPGVRGGALSGFSFAMSSGGFAINGGRSQDSVLTFDGAVATRTRANGTSIGSVDLDTVQEVQVLTANYSAEYGRSAAGQIRIVTRSGQRDFHGAAYEYFRNSALDANSWSRNTNPATNFVAPFRFNQFGYNFSGPVTLGKAFNPDREKLFFLWSQEWVRFRRENTTFQRVPSAAMRNGDFSELLGSNIYYGSPRTILDPATGNPFPGNVIPAAQRSPNGMAFLNTYPASNGAFQGNTNFFQVRPNPQNQRKDTVAIDYNPTQNQVFRFRHTNFNWNALDSFRGGFDFATTDWDRPNKTASLNHTWTLGPTMINEFLVSASVDRVFIEIDRRGERFLRSRSGINYPYLFPERKEIFDKVPTIAIPNVGTIDGGPYPASSTGPIYQISNNFTKIAGNHTFKFGALFERSGQNDFDQINVSGVPGGTNNQNGRFVFNDVRPGGAPGTGTGIANAAMGLFSSYAEIGPRSFTPYRSHMFEFFGQDSWRVTQKLKLELGFRATWMNGYAKSLWGNMAYFDPARYDPNSPMVIDRATGNILSGDRYNGVVIPGSSFPDAGRGRVPAIDSGEFDRLLSGGSPYASPNQFNVVPRLGLAYQLANKQVLRLGFGGFMARPGVYDSVFLGGNPPWQPMGSVTNGVADNPGGATRVAFPQFFMTIDRVYKIPRSYNWNISYQTELFQQTTLEVGYVGTSGNYLARERDLNQLAPGTTFRPENAGANVNALRPYRGYANINMLEHSARSEYNGLQVELNRRFRSGLSYGFAYTFSKSMDAGSGPREGFIDVFNQGLNWGKSNFDTRHVAVVNFVWEMPWFRDADSAFTRGLLGGWQLSGVTQMQTGTPFTVARGDDYLGIGSSNSKPWNLNGITNNPRKFGDEFWFEPTVGGQAWATRPADGTYPNQNRQSIPFHQPGFQNWNLAAFKTFKFSEATGVQFRFEAFNWPNHPNFSGANTNPTDANFGKVLSKGSQRELQMSLRFFF
ncbi:MAG: Plug and carboxypeptidase regulatory-like domain-containing protein [Bryobacteraceae bacterium]|nr:Plug and carboxypeptidase regulatory-like domain-containing protein [Bryobacteraceae bacterium]